VVDFKEKFKKSNYLGEYRNLVGNNIPYRTLGFSSLQDFLDNAKTVCKISFSNDSGAIVRAISSEETFHIQEMVRKQVRRDTIRKNPFVVTQRMSEKKRQNFPC
jgi:hypothetical protein